MMGSLWCGIRSVGSTELHMFPVSSDTTACGCRRRGVDDISFIMNGSPSSPGGCVCRACWDAFVGEVLA